MKTFVGIDLGSTTTKAVLLDENSHVIGRGITNSRSNYATAARVASEEARIDGRFTLFRRALSAAGGLHGHLDEFLGALERAFRLEQFLEQLDDLEATCRGQVKGDRFAGVENGVQDAIGVVFTNLRTEAPERTRAPSASRTSSATSPAPRAITTRPKRSRATPSCPTTCCSTSMTSDHPEVENRRPQASSARNSAARWAAFSPPIRRSRPRSARSRTISRRRSGSIWKKLTCRRHRLRARHAAVLRDHIRSRFCATGSART